MLELLERCLKALTLRLSHPITLTLGLGKCAGDALLGDFRALFLAGADKVSINSGAVRDPEVVRAAAEHYGAQAVVLSIDVKRRGREWRDLAHLSGGEKVLTVEAMILSLHLLSDSPVHAIDEFTQRTRIAIGDQQLRAGIFERIVQLRLGVTGIERHDHEPGGRQADVHFEVLR